LASQKSERVELEEVGVETGRHRQARVDLPTPVAPTTMTQRRPAKHDEEQWVEKAARRSAR
jgi:hypothetical protein